MAVFGKKSMQLRQQGSHFSKTHRSPRNWGDLASFCECFYGKAAAGVWGVFDDRGILRPWDMVCLFVCLFVRSFVCLFVCLFVSATANSHPRRMPCFYFTMLLEIRTWVTQKKPYKHMNIYKVCLGRILWLQNWLFWGSLRHTGSGPLPLEGPMILRVYVYIYIYQIYSSRNYQM